MSLCLRAYTNVFVRFVGDLLNHAVCCVFLFVCVVFGLMFVCVFVHTHVFVRFVCDVVCGAACVCMLLLFVCDV